MNRDAQASSADSSCAGSVGLVTPRSVRLFEPPDVLQLACGRTLGPIDVAYESYSHRLEGASRTHVPCDFYTETWPWSGWPSKCRNLGSDRYGSNNASTSIAKPSSSTEAAWSPVPVRAARR